MEGQAYNVRCGMQVGLAVSTTCVATVHGCTSGNVEAGNEVAISFESLDPFGNKVCAYAGPC